MLGEIRVRKANKECFWSECEKSVDIEVGKENEEDEAAKAWWC